MVDSGRFRDRVRLVVAMTHPVQYAAPWFRYIARCCPQIDLLVLYAAQPDRVQQSIGFGRPFAWDVPLIEGYPCQIVGTAPPGASFASDSFWGLDVPELARAVVDALPDVVLVPGWHSAALLRAIAACRWAGIPLLYRGDTTLKNAPLGVRRLVWELRTLCLLRLFDAYLAVGSEARRYLQHFGVPAARVYDAPHCVDNEFFAHSAAPHQTAHGRARARAALGIPADAFAVLFVGKLEPIKRPLDLVRAAARFGSGIHLVVVGSGALERACRDEADRCGVSVSWVGFLNQSELGLAYAAADCLVLPSARESWGLVLNEAMATGLPCIASDGVGGAADLIREGETGAVYPAGDCEALAAALHRIRAARAAGRDFAAACRQRAAAHSFAAATAGLLAACQAVVRPRLRGVPRRAPLRIVAPCGNMVLAGGSERMTFEVLRVLRERSARVHCIANRWENHRIVALAEQIGATWSTGFYWYRFDRHTRNPVKLAQFAWDVARTSLGLIRDALRLRATHVFVPEFTAALRNGPALLLFRLLGLPVVLRVGTVPAEGRFYRIVWGWVLPRLVSVYVANSRYVRGRLRRAGVGPRRILLIPNSVSRRFVAPEADADVVALARSRPTVLSVGQVAPFKGPHILLEAVRQLRGEGFDVQAVIVGHIPRWPAEYVAYAREVQWRAAADGLAGHVHFVGERANVLEIMRASYVLAAPFLPEEAFGNVVLEARSVGLPSVVFPTGGLPELVEHGVTGYVCADRSPESLAAGLRFFLAQPEVRRRASAACLASMKDPLGEYGEERFSAQWWDLFQRV